MVSAPCSRPEAAKKFKQLFENQFGDFTLIGSFSAIGLVG
jgi:hypothetical protein